MLNKEIQVESTSFTRVYAKRDRGRDRLVPRGLLALSGRRESAASKAVELAA